VALLRALVELNQFLLADLPVNGAQRRYSDPDARHWWSAATRWVQPQVVPSGEPAATCDTYASASRGRSEPGGDVRRCIDIAHSLGSDVLVLDQTRPDIGLPVVRVVAPGLRHHWPRLAAGRLYDVPVKLGWLSGPRAEAEMNPPGLLF
jgi:ribosomal protein S12 methylthiotransferase accessory factor